MTLKDHPALLRRFRDLGAAILVTLLSYLLTYLLTKTETARNQLVQCAGNSGPIL